MQSAQVEASPYRRSPTLLFAPFRVKVNLFFGRILSDGRADSLLFGRRCKDSRKHGGGSFGRAAFGFSRSFSIRFGSDVDNLRAIARFAIPSAGAWTISTRNTMPPGVLR